METHAWSKRGGRVLAATLVVVAALAVVAAPVGADSSVAIDVTDGSCASGWNAPGSGVSTFTVHNEGRNATAVELVAAGRPRVYGDLEVVAAGATRSLTVRLPPGRYQWRCELASGATVLSKAEPVTGRAVRGVHASEPVTLDELTPIATQVRDATQPALAGLATQTDALRAAVDAGHLDDARATWLAAHLAYERLGVAYGTFDDFDASVNGRPEGLRRGTADPHWSGFLRLEHGLWGGEPASSLAPVADQLDADVHALVADFPNEFTDVRDIPLRVHEILENTLQFVLTGDADQGSHTALATARANVDGTRSVLDAVEPVLKPRAPKLLAASIRGLDGLAAILDRYHRADGSWLGLADLTPAQREELDGRVGDLLETLAPIPDVLELPRDAGQD